MTNQLNDIKRGDILMVDLSGSNRGSEQGGTRPVLVIQNDIGNRFSPCLIVAMITGQLSKRKMPTHVHLNTNESNLPRTSVVLMEQIRTIDKSRVLNKVGNLSSYKMNEINHAMLISLGAAELVPA